MGTSQRLSFVAKTWVRNILSSVFRRAQWRKLGGGRRLRLAHHDRLRVTPRESELLLIEGLES